MVGWWKGGWEGLRKRGKEGRGRKGKWFKEGLLSGREGWMEGRKGRGVSYVKHTVKHPHLLIVWDSFMALVS